MAPDPNGIKPIKLRPPVDWFASKMERVLRVHDAKKGKEGWKTLTDDVLMEHLMQHTKDLQRALDANPNLETVREAVHVANYAMMIADNAKTRLQHYIITAVMEK